MNMIYLARGESGSLLPPSDRRWKHVRTILKKTSGDTLAAGCEDGTTGVAKITRMDDDGLILSYTATAQATPLQPLRVLMGFPRPIQAGRIIKDLTSLGVSSLWFTLSELGEKSYAESTFFRTGSFSQHLIEGVEQAANPLMPDVRTFWSLSRALAELGSTQGSGMGRKCSKILLHPDDKNPMISMIPDIETPLTLAIGSERGWTKAEIELFIQNGFTAARLGSRILKTETAALAAVSVILARLGVM